jgi:hypothetical protein
MYHAFIHRYGGCPLSPLKISLTDKKSGIIAFRLLKKNDKSWLLRGDLFYE